MFTVINTSQRDQKSALLAHIFKTREGDRDAYDTADTIYIAFDRRDWGVFGSARLNFLKDSPAAGRYSARYGKEGMKNRMEVSLVSFDMHTIESDIHESRFDRSIQDFYEGLLEVVHNIAITKGLEGIESLSFCDDFEDLTFFGKWCFTQSEQLDLKGDPYVIAPVFLKNYDRPILNVRQGRVGI